MHCHSNGAKKRTAAY
ncbi:MULTISPECIES: hypothetical protein [Clostridia]